MLLELPESPRVSGPEQGHWGLTKHSLDVGCHLDPSPFQPPLEKLLFSHFPEEEKEEEKREEEEKEEEEEGDDRPAPPPLFSYRPGSRGRKQKEGLNPLRKLCDLGQVPSPLWASSGDNNHTTAQGHSQRQLDSLSLPP